jgi:hypothetical protein
MTISKATLLAIALLLTACAKPNQQLFTPIPSATALPSIIDAVVSPTATYTQAADEPMQPQLTATAITNAPVETLTATALTPLPTSTFPISTPQMLNVEASLILMPSWSPDSRWIAYWVPASPDGSYWTSSIPIFYEIATGRTCDYPQFAGGIAPEFPNTFTLWQPDGYATLVVNGVPFAGLPCGDFVRAPDSFVPSGYAPSQLSPDGKYRVTTVYKLDEAGNPIAATTTITDEATGAVLNTVQWRNTVGQILGWIGGQWIGSTMFMLRIPADQGPLLIHVGDPHIVEVLPELFGITFDRGASPSPFISGVIDESSGSYHLLLQLPFGNMLLYHSETNDIERLPFLSTGYMYSTYKFVAQGFSPDGKWLLMQVPDDHPHGDPNKTWIRPVDGRKQTATYFGRISYGLWNEPMHTIAYTGSMGNPSEDVYIMSFPDGQVLSRWHLDDATLSLLAWSPDGTMLLLQGTVSTNGQTMMRLYIAQP